MSQVATVSLVGDDLVVRPTLGTLPEMKTIGATWDVRQRHWRLPAVQMNANALAELIGDHGVEVPGPAPVAVTDKRLLGFQREGVARLVGSRRGHILVASPGLGKTVMAVVAADMAVPDDQIVIVAPSSLLRNWRREIAAWGRGDTSTAVVRGDPDWAAVSSSRWVVTSWEMLIAHQDWFLDEWPLWILDESIQAKTRSSARSLALRGGTKRGKLRPDGSRRPDQRWANLMAGVDRVWLLSAFPTSRYNDDLWAQLNVIWPRAFRSYWRFAERYCVVEENRWSPGPGVVVANRRDRDVMVDNSDLVTVINQDSVIDLPEYLPEVVDVELTPKQRVAYESMLRDFVAVLDSGEEVLAENKIGQITDLQRIVSYWDGSSAKHDALLQLIEGRAYEFPILVWTHWREGGEALVDRLRRARLRVGHARGGMRPDDLDDVIESYKRGDLQVLVMSTKVGKFGHTLINSKTIVYVDKTWDADDYVQSLGRGRRIGLTHRPVLATIRAPGTTDELVELNLEGKLPGMSKVTNADLKELLLGLGR